MRNRLTTPRRGAAAVEFAVVLPILVFMFVVAVDWGRIFYHSIIVNNCARNGAVFASDPWATTLSPYANVSEAALADAGNLSPAPSVASASGTDSYGKYVDCTVTYNFKTITKFPGIPADNAIVRTVRVYEAPRAPK